MTTIPLPPEQEAVLSSVRMGLQELASKSEKANELLAWFDELAEPLNHQRPDLLRLTQTVGRKLIVSCDPRTPTGFVASFDDDPAPFIYVNGVAPSMLAGGLSLTFGLSMAQEYLVHGRKMGRSFSQSWLEHTLRAHQTTGMVLQQYVGQPWADLLERRRRLMNAELRKRGIDPEQAFYPTGLPQDQAELEALFGQLDECTLNLLRKHLIIGTIYRSIELIADSKGLTAAQRWLVLLSVTRSAYETWLG